MKNLPRKKPLHPTAGDAPVFIRAFIPAVNELDLEPENECRKTFYRFARLE